jgi:hypothetical protein
MMSSYEEVSFVDLKQNKSHEKKLMSCHGSALVESGCIPTLFTTASGVKVFNGGYGSAVALMRRKGPLRIFQYCR